jgi:hypothetical protein
MTEAEWLREESARRKLDWVKKLTTQPLAIRQRKYRLLAVAVARFSYRWPDSLQESCDLIERYVDGLASLVEFREAADRARGVGLAHTLLSHDPFLSASGMIANCSPLSTHSSVDSGNLIEEVFGNPFRHVTFSSEWRTDTAITLAQQMYDSRDFSAMPILADALQDAGCDSDDILSHCRGDGPHVRGCWVVDLVLGKE